MAKRLNSKQVARTERDRGAGLLGRLQGSTIPLLLVALATGLIVYDAQRSA
jgi:hypothetical protein